MKSLAQNELHQIMLLLEDISCQKNNGTNKKIKPGQGNEIHITDAIKNLIYNGENFMERYLKENI